MSVAVWQIAWHAVGSTPERLACVATYHQPNAHRILGGLHHGSLAQSEGTHTSWPVTPIRKRTHTSEAKRRERHTAGHAALKLAFALSATFHVL